MAVMVRVCHVVNAVGDTSAPADLATGLCTHTDVTDVAIVAWFRADAFDDQHLLTVHEIGAPRNGLGVDAESYRRLRRIVADYDVVHTHHNHSGLYGKIAAKRAGRATVTTEHNNHAGFSRKGRLVNGLTNPFVDRVVCVSESVVDSLTRWESLLLSDAAVEVINNGIDLDRLERAAAADWRLADHADVAADAIVVGSAGMLTRQKGHDVLVRAIARANQHSDVPIEAVIVGRGDQRDELEAEIQAAGVGDAVHLLGYLERREFVYAMMRQVDVYAMPSRWEGFCVAALEALALGTPCVFSDIDEFHRPFADVAAFHRVDDPDALAAELVDLADDSDRRERLGRRGSDLVRERYSMETVAQRYADLYRSVIDDQPTGTRP